MNIIILTQPLLNNYGGLLQAYALQVVLKKMGHTVYTEDRRYDTRNRSLLRRIRTQLKALLDPYADTPKKQAIISQHTKKFIEKNITRTVPIYGTNKDAFAQYAPDAYIVGSDQVWRPAFSFGIYNYFLDFTKGQKVKRISYAASFGTDQWEFSPEEEAICADLLSRFDAVSVREDSGVALCQQHFKVTPELVADPTMLLTANDYLHLIQEENSAASSHSLMTYILNHKREENYRILEKASQILGLKVIEGYPRHRAKEVTMKEIDQCVIKPVETWIRDIYQADFVVTDSFHGTVFSLLFGKQFVVIDNTVSGSTRLRSILGKFGLSSRLVSTAEEITAELLHTPIDYAPIQPLMEKERQHSLGFLTKALQQ